MGLSSVGAGQQLEDPCHGPPPSVGPDAVRGRHHTRTTSPTETDWVVGFGRWPPTTASGGTVREAPYGGKKETSSSPLHQGGCDGPNTRAVTVRASEPGSQGLTGGAERRERLTVPTILSQNPGAAAGMNRHSIPWLVRNDQSCGGGRGSWFERSWKRRPPGVRAWSQRKWPGDIRPSTRLAEGKVRSGQGQRTRRGDRE